MEENNKNQKFDEITEGMAELLKIKNSGYGSSYDKVPEILNILFRGEDINLDKVYFASHLMEKLQRYISSDKIDSLNDAIGYCILERSKYPTSEFLSDPGNELSLTQGGVEIDEKKERRLCENVFWVDVLEFYGYNFRISKAIEELTELKEALLNWQTINSIPNPDRKELSEQKEKVLKEMADVKITLLPLKIFFDPNGELYKEAENDKLNKFICIFKEDMKFPNGSVNID